MHETLNTYVKNAYLKENNSDNDKSFKSLHNAQFEKIKIFPLLLQVRGQSKTREIPLQNSNVDSECVAFHYFLDHKIQNIQRH